MGAPKKPPRRNEDNVPCYECAERLATTWYVCRDKNGKRHWLCGGGSIKIRKHAHNDRHGRTERAGWTPWLVSSAQPLLAKTVQSEAVRGGKSALEQKKPRKAPAAPSKFVDREASADDDEEDDEDDDDGADGDVEGLVDDTEEAGDEDAARALHASHLAEGAPGKRPLRSSPSVYKRRSSSL